MAITGMTISFLFQLQHLNDSLHLAKGETNDDQMGLWELHRLNPDAPPPLPSPKIQPSKDLTGMNRLDDWLYHAS